MPFRDEIRGDIGSISISRLICYFISDILIPAVSRYLAEGGKHAKKYSLGYFYRYPFHDIFSFHSS